MNKAELIAKLADDAGITKTQANATIDSFVSAVTKTLKGGGKVTLVGFGTFSVTKRAARNGRNPQTGAVIKIKAKKVAKFKAGKELSAKIYPLLKKLKKQDACVSCFFFHFKILKTNTMGRGDKKTKKGKIFKGSFGKSRPAKAGKKAAPRKA